MAVCLGRANVPQDGVVGVDQLAVAGLPQHARVADHGAAAAAEGEWPEVSGRRGNDFKHLGHDLFDGLVVTGALEALWRSSSSSRCDW